MKDRKEHNKYIENSRKAKRTVKVRLTEEEGKILDSYAKEFKNQTLYIKSRILHYDLKPPAPVINKDTFLSLGKIGININQLTRRINSSEANIFHRSTKKELMEEINALKEILFTIQENINIHNYDR
ncbi:plasmid mobilization relaxosome protein MobC [Plebeiibacterium sediminum]|uniref:MobC family plasmid mobilization relaxosome protein n=1 Tax=Plebeiibacterium sediminum TaxID=2992112 RepID=A0AAE3M9Q6_9BACT|nr:plasmid mobilization relaxosome protein MobC [Plebeiobacterium sediminum]MCW3789399.1 MobC family plasmid mobilization relaxosome protein [Plebeiobacterium sediminum]